MSNSLIRTTTIAAALVALAALGASPVHSTRTFAQGPTIRIDFRAVTTEGQPVVDLKASEVSLRIAGKPREITELDLVQPGGGGAEAKAAPATPAFTSNVGGASAGTGRTILFAVDDESINIGRDQGLKAALTSIVAGLGPGDRVGLVSVRRAGGVNIAPTTNHATVQKAIDSLKGEGTTENAQDFRCRTTSTLQQLEAIIGSAAGAAPTTIVFLSASLMQPGEQIAAITASPDSGRSSDLCRLTSQSYEALANAAAGSRAQVYVAHVPEGTTMNLSDAALGVESVAGSVGAATMRISGDGKAVAERILGETQAYYVATIAPNSSDKGSQPQRMELRVERSGVTVRARQSITPMRLAAAGGGGVGGSRSGGKKMAPREMIQAGGQFTDLPLRTSAYVSRNSSDGKVRVMVLFQSEDSAAKLQSAVVALIPATGKALQVTVPNDALAADPAVTAIPVEPGDYRLRVAAVDSQGRSGAVDHTLKAELSPAGSYQVSSPLFGPAPTSGGFKPKLLFTAQDTALVSYVEVYGVAKDANMTAMLELAPSDDAPALGSTEAQVRQGPAEDARIIIGGFSIDTLAAGEYVVRTIINVDGKPVGRAMGTMRKSADK